MSIDPTPLPAATRLLRRCLLGACVAVLPALIGAASAAAVTLPSGGFHESIAFPNLEEPTNVRFAPDGEVFVSEKTGDILVYEGLADKTPEVFADLQEQVYDNGDRGLLGLELAPDFPTEPYVYALYTFNHVIGEEAPGEYPAWENESGEPTGDPCPKPEFTPGVDACPVSGRLVRLTAEGEHAGEEKVLLEGWCQQDSSHSIGQLHFGPEGALYVSGGDGASFTSADYGQFGWPQPNQCGDPPGSLSQVEAGTSQALEPPTAEGGALRAQDLRTPGDPTDLNGAILRIDPSTGEGLSDNPLASSLDPNARRIIAYGFRNPFRFALDPQSDSIYVDNVGWETDEEMDRLPMLPGAPYNSGWPCYEGDGPTPAYQTLELSICENLYAEPDAVSPPLFFYEHTGGVTAEDPCLNFEGSAISGISVYRGAAFPEKYDGAVFFADSVRGCIYVMPPGEDGEPDPLAVEPFLSGAGLYPGIDVEEGPEGGLYYTQLYGPEYGPGAIHRVSYEPDAPDAKLTADRLFGNIPPEGLEITFDAGESTGPSGELEFDWDLDGNGTFETHGGEQREVTYTNYEENASVAVRVTDKVSHISAVAELTVYPGDEPSDVEIAEPDGSLTWGVGQKIDFSGSTIEFSSGEPLPPFKLYWKTRLLHCPFGEGCHRHPLQVFPNTEEGSFFAPDHDYPSEIELSLTATDFRGLATTKTVMLKARPVDLAIASDPPGISVTAAADTKPAPFTLTAIEDATITLSAPQTVQSGGATLSFDNWSDGGDRVHAVFADAPAEYVAHYSSKVLPPGEESTSPPSGKSTPPQEGKREISRPELGKHPVKKSQSKAARFTFHLASQGSLRFRCRLDKGKYRQCRSPKAYRHLKPGRHVFSVQAYDPSGGEAGKPATFKWRVVKP